MQRLCFGLTVWSARFQQLTEFKVQFGNCLVPKQCAVHPKLGTWVLKQRHNYKFESCIRMESQVPLQPNAFMSSRVLDSTRGQARLIVHPFGAYDINKCVNSRYSSAAAATSCHNSTLRTQAQAVGFEPAQQLQVAPPGRKANSHSVTAGGYLLVSIPVWEDKYASSW